MSPMVGAGRACVVFAAVALGCPLIVSPHSAQAQAPLEKSAEARFVDAQTLFEKRTYQAALPAFKELLAETGSPNARLYVARCLREVGQLPEAYDEMKRTVKEATVRAETDDKYTETRDAAAAEVVLLEARVARIVVAAVDGSVPKAIRINGASVAVAELGSPRTVLPGKVFVEIDRDGVETERRELDIPPGEIRTIALGGAVAKTEPKPEPKSEGGALRWIGVAVGVLGVGSFATFIGTAVSSDEIFAEVESACGGTRCTSDAFVAQIDEGRTLDTVATATAILGGVLVAGAIPMIIVGGPSSPEEVPRVSLGLHGARLTWHLD